MLQRREWKLERTEIGFGVKYIAFQKKLVRNNMYIPSLYIYLVYTQLEMNVFYHVVYVLVHKIETINICQSFHIQSAYFKAVGVFKKKNSV